MEVSTITLTWRGVWASESATVLEALDISQMTMKGITRVLKGSYLNFRRFNEMTIVFGGKRFMGMTGWSPPQTLLS